MSKHEFQVSNLGTGDKCGVCGKTRSQHGPVEAAALHAGKVAAYKRHLARTIDLLTRVRDGDPVTTKDLDTVIDGARAVLRAGRATK